MHEMLYEKNKGTLKKEKKTNIVKEAEVKQHLELTLQTVRNETEAWEKCLNQVGNLWWKFQISNMILSILL